MLSNHSTSYEQAIQNLEQRPVMPEKPPSLEIMHRALPLIGFFESPFYEQMRHAPERCIVVAGTNGKGSVCATLEALLLSAGCRVGMYTSPHLIHATERIRLQGQDITREHFAKSFEQVETLTAKWQTEYAPYTHFEMTTLMALWYLTSGKLVPAVDWLILEVGLGGIWDATNAVPHGTAVITTLGLDHQALLGSTIESIAENKFGIIHKHTKVVHSPLPSPSLAVAEKVKENTQSTWIPSVPFTAKTISDKNRARYFIDTQWGAAELNLPGERGAQNTATALTTFQVLGFDPTPHLPALRHVRWPGRMHEANLKSAPCPVYFSGDHNVQGVQSLLQILSGFSVKHVHFVVGVAKDKGVEEILQLLMSFKGAKLYLTETTFKPLPLSQYGKTWLTLATAATPNPKEALDQAIANATSDDIIVVTGSLYLVGALMDYSSNRI